MDTVPDLYGYVMGHFDRKHIPRRVVADESGVPYGTVTKIAQRETLDPTVSTCQRLANYFATKSAPPKVSPGEASQTHAPAEHASA